MTAHLALAALLPLLAACADRPLPVASGPIRQMNVGHWMPGPNELTTLAVIKAGP